MVNPTHTLVAPRAYDPRRVVTELIPAGDSSDKATRRTVELMCSYIREAVKDPRVIACADYARRRFAAGSDSPDALCWGVFWYVKHCVTVRRDEILLSLSGYEGEQDALVHPSVLMRMEHPREDCDGFSMLTAALLTILGVPAVIATVEADSRRPGEFSHVFVCGQPGGRTLSLDTSHGAGPGWMVPPSAIRRWQCWTLDGKPSDVKMPRRGAGGLHGFFPALRPGVGMGYYDASGEWQPDESPFPVNTTGPAPPAGTDWSTFLQQLAQQGVSLTSRILTPPAYQQTVTGPGGTSTTIVRSQAGPSTAFSAAAGGFASPNLLLWVGGGAALLLLGLSISGRRR